MKKKNEFQVFCLCFFLISLSFAEPVRLSVLYFDPPPYNPKFSFAGKALAEMLGSSLSGVKGLVVVERSGIEKLSKEMALAQSGLIDESSAPAVGKMLGANFLVYGSIIVQGKDVAVTWKIVNVSTSAIEGGGTVPGKAYKISGISEKIVQGVISALSRTGISANPVKNDTSAILTIDQVAGFGSALDKADKGDLRGARAIADSIVKEAPSFSACTFFISDLEKKIAAYEKIREKAMDTLMSGDLTYQKYQKLTIGMMTGMQYSGLLDFCLSCRGKLPAAPEGSMMTTEESNDYYICLAANMLKKWKVLSEEGDHFLSAYPGSMYFGSIKMFLEQAAARNEGADEKKKDARAKAAAAIKGAPAEGIGRIGALIGAAGTLSTAGLHEEAIKVLSKIDLKECKEGITPDLVLYQIFSCYYSMSDKENAKEILSSVRTTYPKSDYIQAMQSMLSVMPR